MSRLSPGTLFDDGNKRLGHRSCIRIPGRALHYPTSPVNMTAILRGFGEVDHEGTAGMNRRQHIDRHSVGVSS